MTFQEELIKVFSEHANEDNALAMSAYMKHKFTFFGIKSQERKALLKQVESRHKEALVFNCREVVLALFQQPQRELHYCAQEILTKYLKKKYLIEDIDLIKKLLTTQSWWDSVDHISKWILGFYLKQYPSEINHTINEFSNSDNMWLVRSTILYQLGYKKETNEAILFQQCLNHKTSNEFFIQKAIGWALREYAKVNPEAVLNFVKRANLKPLSTREAIRNIL